MIVGCENELLSDWAEQVIKRDSNCVLCGSKQNLEAHHIFKVNEFDDAYLDLNNGITLCKSCHKKYHDKYGLDCNIKNLLEIKLELSNPSYKRLIKNHGNACNQIKKLKETNRILEKKHENTCSQKRDLEEKNKKLKKENKKLRKKMTNAYINAFL